MTVGLGSIFGFKKKLNGTRKITCKMEKLKYVFKNLLFKVRDHPYITYVITFRWRGSENGKFLASKSSSIAAGNSHVKLKSNFPMLNSSQYLSIWHLMKV